MHEPGNETAPQSGQPAAAAAPASAPPLLLTIRDVARECGTRVHRAAYAVREYGVAPRQRVGIVRLWSRDQIPAVREALAKVDRNRRFRPPPRTPGRSAAAVPA